MNKHPSITIEAVANGWIVRPFTRHACGESYPMHVFITMHDLQIALPDLLSRPGARTSEWCDCP
jgi:hypothetical protein